MESMILDQQFRDIVTREMQAQGIDNEELSARMGRSENYMNAYLGTAKTPPCRKPGPDVMEAAFHALGLTPSLVVTRMANRNLAPTH
jgi:type II secretory pathway component PulJ